MLRTPDYPSEFRKEGIEGVVELEVFVSKEGWVDKVYVIDSPHPELSSLAIVAAYQSIYEPGLIDGEPAAWKLVVPVTFDLNLQ